MESRADPGVDSRSGLGTATDDNLALRHAFWSIACLPPERWDEAIDRLALGSRLCDELRVLLAHLTVPATTPAQFREGDAAARLPGERPLKVGDFLLKRQLGAGGMGIVYEAWQEQLNRPVALKVMHPSSAGERSAARLLLEAEILARLRHPGIAQVFDAGVCELPEGPTPYVAMELVPDARSVTEHAHELAMDARDRIALMTSVCDAIAHGHQHGVIHRDIKPFNVLVGSEGGPKVIDFGLARLCGQAEALKRLTAPNAVMGTLPYLPPEALSRGHDAADTRADVYALGVLLYELLCGRLPIDFGAEPLWACLERVRDGRVLPLRDAAPGVPRDVDAIVRRAMAPDPERRYASAAELALDLRRYTEDRPVLAREGSAWYALQRYVVRRRGVFAAMCCVALTVVVGAVVSTGFAISEARARELATRRSAGFEQLTDFLVADVFEAADPRMGPGPGLEVGRALDAAVERLGAIGDEVHRASVGIRLGQILCAVGKNADAEPVLRAAVQSLGGVASGGGWQTLEYARARRELGRCLSNRNRYAEALASIERSLAVRREALPPGHRDVIETLSAHASVLNALRRVDEARASADEALAMCDAFLRETDPLIAQVCMRAAQIEESRGDYRAASLLLERALAVRSGSPAVSPAELADTSSNLGLALARLGDAEAARAHLSRAYDIRLALLPADHSNVLHSRSALAYLELSAERYPSAATLLRDVLASYERTRGPDDLYVARTLVALGKAEVAAGHAADGERRLRRALRILDRFRDDDPQGYVAAQSLLGEALLEQGAFDEAHGVLSSARESLRAMQEPNATLVERTESRWRRLRGRGD